MATSHTYHMFPFEDRPPHYFLDQIFADPVLNIPENMDVQIQNFSLCRCGRMRRQQSMQKRSLLRQYT